ncbi:MAG: DUF2752 domain-containing protein [Trichocoleus desertorum ATA4-8-CV12]|nr:DUF2752 domain-containing protein [Trichocoleus desertorum ATA4-8-CV12]
MLAFSKHALSRQGRLIRWGVLGLCAAPIAGAYWYSQGYRLPFLGCPIRHLTGIPCPTCGMTRSFMAIAQGDWNQALVHHLFGPVLFVSLAIAAVHLLAELVVGRRITTGYSALISQRQVHYLGLAMFLSYHIWRLYGLSQSGELSLAFLHSPLGHMLFASPGMA